MTKQLFVWARTIHRLVLWPTSILIVLMAGTGSILKWPFLVSSYETLRQVAHWHEEISTFFVMGLVIMMGTGLYMYIFPKLIASKR